MLCLLMIVGLLIVGFFAVALVSAQPDFEAFLGQTIADDNIDAVIGAEWDDAGYYSDVAFDPTGTGELWAKQDSTHVYFAVKFTADS